MSFMAKSLKSCLQKTFTSSQKWKYKLLSDWTSIIGPLSSKVRIEKIVGSTVILGVYNSCWLQELYLLSPLLIQTINKSLDNSPVKELRFKRVTVYKKPTRKQFGAKSKSQECSDVCLTSVQEQALDTIADKELQAALKKFLNKCCREKKNEGKNKKKMAR